MNDKFLPDAQDLARQQNIFSPHDVVLGVGEMELGWSPSKQTLGRSKAEPAPGQNCNDSREIANRAADQMQQLAVSYPHDSISSSPPISHMVSLTNPSSPPP
eukprot:472780-Hanusia_phi.AAC.1